MDSWDYSQGIPVLDVQEKPWRKAGADISDYFNYGFDEQSWNAYCKKQAKLFVANRKLYTKTRVQKGHTTHGETQPPAYSSSCILASRESSATTDLTGGRPGPSSRVEGHSCVSDEGNNTQVVTEMFPKGLITYHLNPELSFNSLLAWTTPPRRPPLSPVASLDSRHAKEFDDPSSSLDPRSSGVSSLIPASLVYSAGVMNTAKAWECVARCDTDRDRSREQGRDRDRKRDSESCSSSHNSREDQMRHRDTMERGHKHQSLKRVRGEGQLTERRQKNKGCSSSRSGREDGEERERQSGHKHKKTKRNKKDEETDKMSSADPERKLKSV
ncbi:pre-mRNA 3'-end-processing factor FIP1 isoform X2 [Seriola aureovittata]|uniref:pre-mRNA 3'-end-processing factor FIP1 isoform X2 n=1 Tax=Seriola aureovittata TaxID=2871759 RepID=UPI0024BDF38D|nr:pre-mRNA 3'-end-processing factor FIP1 isoform X2 [Seriola aureovittata]